MIPILWAMPITLSCPTLVESRTNAQLIEPAVDVQRSFDTAAGLVVRSSMTLRSGGHRARARAVDGVVGRVAVHQRGGEGDDLERGAGLAPPDADVAMLSGSSAKSSPDDHRLHRAGAGIDRHQRRDPVGAASAAWRCWWRRLASFCSVAVEGRVDLQAALEHLRRAAPSSVAPRRGSSSRSCSTSAVRKSWAAIVRRRA